MSQANFPGTPIPFGAGGETANSSLEKKFISALDSSGQAARINVSKTD